jgi:GTP-binding protein EngB required for normal cell division
MAREMSRQIQGMVLVMGVTGAGKSHFVNTLVGKSVVEEWRGIDSRKDINTVTFITTALTRLGTKSCTMVLASLNDRDSIAIVDTPGFDDSHRGDDEILDEIAQYLTVQFQLGLRLKGIVYLHPITQTRMTGHDRQYLELFKRLCGEHTFPNIKLVTTMWDRIIPSEEGLAYARDRDIRDTCWNMMEERGSEIISFDGSSEMAQTIIYGLASQETVVLQIQKEMCQRGMNLENTHAGQLVVGRIEADIRQDASEIQAAEQQINSAVARRDWPEAEKLKEDVRKKHDRKADRMKRRQRLGKCVKDEANAKIEQDRRKFGVRDAVTVFMAVVGITVNILVHFVPL